jgi:hypothetical protein
MLQVNNLIGFGAGGAAGPLVLTYLDYSEKTSGTSHTGMSFGAASAGRYLVAVGHVRQSSGSDQSSVTIGGVSATIVIQSGGSINRSFIAIALVPTGTSGTVAWSGSAQASAVNLYSLTGLQSTTPHDTATDNSTSNADEQTLDLNVPEGGAVVSGGASSSNDSMTWNGLSQDQESGNIESGFHVGSASLDDLSAETPRSVSLYYSDFGKLSSVAASWR